MFPLIVRAFRRCGAALSAGALPRSDNGDPPADDVAPTTGAKAETGRRGRALPVNKDGVLKEGGNRMPHTKGGVQLMNELIPVYERLDQMEKRYDVCGVSGAVVAGASEGYQAAKLLQGIAVAVVG